MAARSTPGLAADLGPALARLAEDRRVIAVGTTTLRALESAGNSDGTVRVGGAETDIFITPGYRFQVVDRLITNFHLPKSTLLMLVSAFAAMLVLKKNHSSFLILVNNCSSLPLIFSNFSKPTSK